MLVMASDSQQHRGNGRWSGCTLALCLHNSGVLRRLHTPTYLHTHTHLHTRTHLHTHTYTLTPTLAPHTHSVCTQAWWHFHACCASIRGYPLARFLHMHCNDCIWNIFGWGLCWEHVTIEIIGEKVFCIVGITHLPCVPTLPPQGPCAVLIAAAHVACGHGAVSRQIGCAQRALGEFHLSPTADPNHTVYGSIFQV